MTEAQRPATPPVAAAELLARIEAHYRRVASTAMADVPLCNPRLAVRGVGIEDWDGQRIVALVTPWAINLLRLPGSAPLPSRGPLAKHVWRLPSGDYAFVEAGDVGFGPFQSCSLFSPVLEFDSQAAACETALAALLALLRPPLAVPEAVAVADARPSGTPAPSRGVPPPAPAEVPSRRRWLLGRGA